MNKILLLAALFATSNIFAQLSLDAVNQGKTIDFDNTVEGINNGNFTGLGFSPTPVSGQINSNGIIILGLSDGNMSFGSAYDSGDYARSGSTPPKSTGGVYAYETAPNNRALGIQSAGSDFTPGAIVIKVQNNTGDVIKSVNVNYSLYIYNDQERSSNFILSYSKDNSDYTEIAESAFVSPEASDDPADWTKNDFNLSFDIELNDTEYLYISLDSNDESGGGGRDEFAIDDIVITPSSRNIALSTNVKPVAKTKLFPNPFKENVTVEASSNITKLIVNNAIGKPVLTVDGNNETSQTFNTESLSNGVYILKIILENNTTICRKVIKR